MSFEKDIEININKRSVQTFGKILNENNIKPENIIFNHIIHSSVKK